MIGINVGLVNGIINGNNVSFKTVLSEVKTLYLLEERVQR